MTYKCQTCLYGRDQKPVKGQVLALTKNPTVHKNLHALPKDLWKETLYIEDKGIFYEIPKQAVPYLLYEEELADPPDSPADYGRLVLWRAFMRTLDERFRKEPDDSPASPAKTLAEAMQPAESLEDFRRQTKPIARQIIKEICITHAPALGWDGAYAVSLTGSDAEPWIYPNAIRPKTISPALLRRVEKFPPHLWEATFLPSHLGMPEALMFLRQRKVPLKPNPDDAPRDLDYAQDIPL